MTDLKSRRRAVADAPRRSRGSRWRRWQLVQRLRRHAEDRLDAAVTATAQLAAIEAERSLLAEPDPLVPVRQTVRTAPSRGADRRLVTPSRRPAADARADARDRRRLVVAQATPTASRSCAPTTSSSRRRSRSVATRSLPTSLDRQSPAAAGRASCGPCRLRSRMRCSQLARRLEPACAPRAPPEQDAEDAETTSTTYVDDVRATPRGRDRRAARSW